jgi:hypothetical protein
MSTVTATDRLTEALEQKLSHPATSSDFDLHAATNEVLKDIGLTTADAGGKVAFYGQDPILPSPVRFGTMAAIGLAARSVALATLWKEATGKGQDISIAVSTDSLTANGKPSMAGHLPPVVMPLVLS